jgi:hypothetical protein
MKGGVGYNIFEVMFDKGEHFDEEFNMDLLKAIKQGFPSTNL